jgi:glyoxylase-like metal-dependent hydrolase (beta-lactamase superfamily II)
MIQSAHLIDAGLFKLDGGAMFGVVPKSMWQKLNPPDENNMCTWALRCLLLQTEDRKILVDCGMGDKQDAKFRSHFSPHGPGNLIHSIRSLGLEMEDITDVFLTHLHFDHCGGAVSRSENGTLIPTFPNARYWSNKRHWDWAIKPNEREKASFLPENILPLEESGVIHFLDQADALKEWPEEISFRYCDGHTEGLMILDFFLGDKHYIYPTDLIPSSFHIGLPYVMAYDVRPLDTLKEKNEVLEMAIQLDSTFIFEHDPIHPFAKVTKTESGRIQIAGYPESF